MVRPWAVLRVILWMSLVYLVLSASVGFIITTPTIQEYNWNLFVFYTYFNTIVSVISHYGINDTPLHDKMWEKLFKRIDKNDMVPAWFSVSWDIPIIIILAFLGHTWYAVLWVISAVWTYSFLNDVNDNYALANKTIRVKPDESEIK